VARAVVEAGWCVVEVPLSAPAALASIARLTEALPADILVGAGTVRTVAEVEKVAEAGGRLIMMPHADPRLIAHADRLGLVVLPGVFTATEAFVALEAGADARPRPPCRLARCAAAGAAHPARGGHRRRLDFPVAVGWGERLCRGPGALSPAG